MAITSKGRAGVGAAAETADRRPIDAWIPWFFVIFFAVVLAADGTLGYFAFSSWTGIGDENRNHYEKGLAYNAELSQVEAQVAAGIRGRLDFRPVAAPGGAGRPVAADEGAKTGVWLELALTNPDGTPLLGAEVQVRALRPTSGGHDTAFVLPALGEGRYGAAVAFSLPGVWDLVVTAEAGATRFRIDKRVMVPDGRS